MQLLAEVAARVGGVVPVEFLCRVIALVKVEEVVDDLADFAGDQVEHGRQKSPNVSPFSSHSSIFCPSRNDACAVPRSFLS